MFLAILCAACAAQDKQRALEAAAKEAMQFFRAFSQPSPQTEAEWGMSEFDVFGRPGILEGLVVFQRMAAGMSTVEKVPDTADTYVVTIPLWVRGKDAAGKPVKLSRTLRLTVVGDVGQANWEVRSHEFVNDRPLTSWRQLRTWLFWSFLGPVLLFVVVFFFSLPWIDPSRLSAWAGLLSKLVGFCTVPLVGGVSWVCFGTWPAVIVGLLVYLAVVGLVVRGVAGIINLG